MNNIKNPESSKRAMLAKAVYDNEAETEEEISFRRGDVVTVLQLEPNGLEGWWLCSFKGRIGIAPGNRLQHLSGGEIEPQVQMRDKSHQPTSKQEQRTSYVYDPNKVVTPSNIGGVFVYNHSSLDHPALPDYDVPKSLSDSRKLPIGQDLYDTPKSKISAYNSPKPDASHIKTIEDLYDKPSNRRHVMGQLGLHLDSHSNRSSGISMLSSVSGTSVSNHSLHSTDSAPPSVRSSADATHDPYDIPQHVKAAIVPSLRKAKSSDNILDSTAMYDSPQKVTRPVRKQFPAERHGGDYCEIHKDNSDAHDLGVKPELPRRNSKEHVLDDLDMYDTPKKHNVREEVQSSGRVKGYQIRGNAEQSGIYDVPPQVTRDSPIQDAGMTIRGGFSGGNTDFKVADFSSVSYDKLVLERDAAVELLVKLQEDLQKAISKLLYFVNSTWRTKENLQPKLFEVKISCMAVRTALQEFVEFGQGTLANAAKLEDKRLARKVHIYLEPVQKTYSKVSQCMAALNAIKWDINKLSTNVVDSNLIDDELNQIVHETKGLTISFVQLGSFIKGNAPLLFERSDSLHEPVHGVILPKSSPQTKPKPPPPIKPKSSFGSADTKNEARLDKAHSIQGRPLPTPPTTPKYIRPATVHSTPQGNTSGNTSALNTGESDKNTVGMTSSPPIVLCGDDYDIPKTHQERQELLELKKRLLAPSPPSAASVVAAQGDTGDYNPYDNAKSPVVPCEDYDQITDQEYDYVALTPEQMKNSIAFKYSQLSASDYDSPKSQPIGCYDSPSSIVTEIYDSSTGNAPMLPPKLYDSPSSVQRKPVDIYDSPQNNSQVRLGQEGMLNESMDLDMSGQMEGMEIPAVRMSGLSTKFQEKLMKLQQEAETSVIVQGDRVSGTGDTLPYRRQSQISEMDKQVLLFYANQIESHYSVLVNAMETLFQAMDYNQPPKVFITNSKFVILAAHKLVYMGDTITRNIKSREVSQGIVLGANLLCDALKESVNATKKAALQFPSVIASQEMVDRVVDISHAAGALKAAIVQPVAT